MSGDAARPTASDTIASFRARLIEALTSGKLAFEHAELAKQAKDPDARRAQVELAEGQLAKARAALDDLTSVVGAFPGKKEDRTALEIGLEKAKEKLEQVEIGIAAMRSFGPDDADEA